MASLLRTQSELGMETRADVTAALALVSQCSEYLHSTAVISQLKNINTMDGRAVTDVVFQVDAWKTQCRHSV